MTEFEKKAKEIADAEGIGNVHAYELRLQELERELATKAAEEKKQSEAKPN